MRDMRKITLFSPPQVELYNDDEVIIFRVKKTSVEGRDKVILQE